MVSVEVNYQFPDSVTTKKPNTKHKNKIRTKGYGFGIQQIKA